MIAPQTVMQGRYLVLEQIGQGGMGAVYRASDLRFHSAVALKETFFDDPLLRRAFEREAHLLNRLRHPALPRVSDYFSEADGQFLVMEFIEGQDLSEMLKARGGPFPPADVLGWADQLLDALEYLHSQDPPVVHRDIKPQNLKLAGRNQVILLDFGLAKGSASQATRSAATGSVLGYSLNYAPLEQMQGVGTDPRSDLYSLGATLYHLLTGMPPPDALTRATAVLNGQPDPLRRADEVNGGVPGGVAEVLAGAMAQSAGGRPRSAEQMRQALRAASAEAGNVETVTRAAAPAVGVSDQETQLATRRGRAPQTAALMAGATSAHHAATVVPPTDSRVGARASRPARGGHDSVVTSVRPAHHVAAEPRSKGRALGVAASVLVLVLAAVAVYSLTRNAPPAAPGAQPAAAPSVQAGEQTPAAAATAQDGPAPAFDAPPAKTTEVKAQPDAKAGTETQVVQAAPEEPARQAEPAKVEPAKQTQPESAGGPSAPLLYRRYSDEEVEAIRAAREAEELRLKKMKMQESEEQRVRELEERRVRALEEQPRQGPPPPPPHFLPPPPDGRRPPPPRP